jgi:hypothetical protein
MLYEEYNTSSEKEINNHLSKHKSDGYYYLEGLHKKMIWKVNYPAEIDENENFKIETSIKKISAGKKRYSSGIIYGSNGNNYYCFVINDRGRFAFIKAMGDNYDVIIPYTESEHINVGKGSTNKLAIKKAEGLIHLYANDNFLTTTPFENFFGNNVGFILSRKQKIAIDYLKVLYSQAPADSNLNR